MNENKECCGKDQKDCCGGSGGAGKKSFWQVIFAWLDKKLQDKAASGGCGCKDKKSGDRSCC
jgi:hypothetical protein